MLVMLLKDYAMPIKFITTFTFYIEAIIGLPAIQVIWQPCILLDIQ